MTRDKLIKTIADMEKRIEDRTYYGKISEYLCDLESLKRKLYLLDNPEVK